MKVLGKRARRAAYISMLSELNIPESLESGQIIDLFAGCGGLSLGFESVGFQTIGYEKEKKYVEPHYDDSE